MQKSCLKKILSFTLSAVLVLSFSGCSSKKDSTLSYPVLEMPQVLDPQIASNPAELTLVENCMEGLVRVDGNGDIVSGVAERWEVSDSGRVYTFYLRNNAKWYLNEMNEELVGKNFDTRITAKDFVFAVERAVDPITDTPDFSVLSNIKGAKELHSGKSAALGIKAKSDNILTITLVKRDDGFLRTLLNSAFMPCNEQFFNATGGRYGRRSQYLITNGQFTLSNWAEESVTIAKNEDYSGALKAKPSSVTLYLEESEDTAFDNFADDKYDLTPLPRDRLDYLSDNDDMSSISFSDTVWVAAFNLSSEYGSDKDFRKSLFKSAERPNSEIPQFFEKAQGIVPDVCTAAGTSYRKSVNSAKLPKKNVSVAQQLYKSVKDKLGVDTAQFTVVCPDFLEDYTKFLVQSWQKNLGTSFAAVIDSVSIEQLEQRVDSGDYTVAIYPLQATSDSAMAFLKKLGSDDNVFSYKSSAYNNLTSKSESIDTVKAAEQHILTESFVMLPLVKSESYYVLAKELNGIYLYDFSGKVNFISGHFGDSNEA